MKFLRHPKLCAVMEISVGHDIYQPLPTVGHAIFPPQYSVLSATVTVIWHDFAVRIDDVRANGTIPWSVHDGTQRRILLSIRIHLIAIYHRVEATTENDPAVQCYPNVVIPTPKRSHFFFIGNLLLCRNCSFFVVVV